MEDPFNNSKEGQYEFRTPLIYRFHMRMRSIFGERYLLGTLVTAVILGAVGTILISDNVKLPRSKADSPDVAILYEQNLAGTYSAEELADPNTQRNVLQSVKDRYDREEWDLNLLEAVQSVLPPFPPQRASLYFAQSAQTQNRGNVPVEGGFISMQINAIGADDDVLVDSYVTGIQPQRADLSLSDAEGRIIVPLDAIIKDTELVYALLPAHILQENGIPMPTLSPTGNEGASIDSVYVSANVLALIDDSSTQAQETAADSEIQPETEPSQEPIQEPTQEPISEPTLEPSLEPSPEPTTEESSVTATSPIPDESRSTGSEEFPSPSPEEEKIENNLDEGEGSTETRGRGTPSSSPTDEPRIPCYFIHCLPAEEQRQLSAHIEPQFAYRLAYRMSIVDGISPFIPYGDPNNPSGGRGRLKGLTKNGLAYCSADTDCIVPDHLCIQNTCQVPKGIGQTCNANQGNHDCDISNGLVCNSVSNTCTVPQLLNQCTIDADCNAPKSNSTNICGADNLCHANDELQNRGAPGTGNGLLGTYYCYFVNGSSEYKFDRIDSKIDFNWGNGSPVTCDNNQGDFLVSWKGKLEPRSSEEYTIYLNVDDGGTVKINGQTLINSTFDPPGEYSKKINLEEGKRYTIDVGMFDKDGPARTVLSWSTPTIPKQVIPQSQLYTFDALPPLVTVQPQDQTVLIGTDIVIGATFDGTSPMTYSMKKNGVDFPIPNSNVPGVLLENVEQSDSGLYTITATNSFGEDTTRSARITVNLPPGGVGTGLRGYYFLGTLLDERQVKHKRVDSVIDFNWGTDLPVPSDPNCDNCLTSPDNWSARWYGEIYIPEAGDYFFSILSDDGARLWINNELIIDNWYIPEDPDPNATVKSGKQTFSSPGKYKIRLDYWEGEDEAQMHLSWLNSNTNYKYDIIPQAFLFPLEFIWPEPNVNVGDIVYVDAITGRILKTISSLINE